MGVRVRTPGRPWGGTPATVSIEPDWRTAGRVYGTAPGGSGAGAAPGPPAGPGRGRCHDARAPDPGTREGRWDHRYLGRTGLLVSTIAFGAMTFGGARSDLFRRVGTNRARRGARARSPTLPPCRGQPVRHGQRLLQRGLRGDAGPGPRGAPQGHRPGDQAPRADRGGRQRPRPVALAHRAGRPRTACGGWARTGSTCCRCTGSTAWTIPRGDPARPGRSGAGRHPALHRLLQLLGLAPDEGAGHLLSASTSAATRCSSPTTAWWAATP